MKQINSEWKKKKMSEKIPKHSRLKVNQYFRQEYEHHSTIHYVMNSKVCVWVQENDMPF